MNCESLSRVMNAAIDGELSPAEETAFQQHLAGCTHCRDRWAELDSIHRDLRNSLRPPNADVAVERLMQSLRPHFGTGQRPGSRRAKRGSKLAVFVAAFTLVLVAGTLVQLSAVGTAVAEIAMTTGTIDLKPANSGDWISVDGASRVHLTANSRVRTRADSLCEIRTTSNAVVRMNLNSELILLRSKKIELVSGEVWCRAPASAGMQISAPSRANHPESPSVFSCPSATEMQWRTLPNQEISCQDVAASPVEIQLPQMTCTIQPGETLTFESGIRSPKPSVRSNPLQATNWQLPLLACRNPDDLELQERMTSMLAVIGQTKISYMYEEKIRQLGPTGVPPLLAFVRSPDSRNKPELRHRAMDLVAEMATPSSVTDLEKLRHDDDPTIRQRAQQALNRLQPKP